MVHFEVLAFAVIFFFIFNALLTQKIVTTVYKNRKVKREEDYTYTYKKV